MWSSRVFFFFLDSVLLLFPLFLLSRLEDLDLLRFLSRLFPYLPLPRCGMLLLSRAWLNRFVVTFLFESYAQSKFTSFDFMKFMLNKQSLLPKRELVLSCIAILPSNPYYKGYGVSKLHKVSSCRLFSRGVIISGVISLSFIKGNIFFQHTPTDQQIHHHGLGLTSHSSFSLSSVSESTFSKNVSFARSSDISCIVVK